MEFYTFVDIPPQLFNDKLQIILGIDYVYTDNTGNVVKKENIGKEENKIQDSVKTVHLILEKGNQLYDADQVSYHNIDKANCSLQTMRDKLINTLEGGIPSTTDNTMAFENFDNDNESDSDSDSDSDTKASVVKSLQIKKSLSRPLSAQSTPRTGNIEWQPLFPKEGQPGWDTSRRLLSATSAQSTPRLGKDEMDKLLDPSNLPEQTSKPTSANKVAKIFANEYNSGTNSRARVEALEKVNKKDQPAVLELFTDQEGPKGKGGLPPRSIVESHFNHFNHLANEGSRPPSGSSQQTLITPGRRALVYNSGSYKIGIVGPINRTTKQYVIDVPSGSDTSYKINSGDFEDNHPIPKNFVSAWYYLLTNSTEKPRNNIFLLKEKSLTQLRTKEQSGRTWGGGKKTKKVYPAKKNITRSKRR